MAITVDDSVVAFAATIAETGFIESAAFTPPNGALLYLCLNIHETTGPNGVTVSGGGLTWTKRIGHGAADGHPGGAEIWTAVVGTGASMTIVVTRDGTGDAAGRRVRAKPYIIEGQAASPIGASNKGPWTVDETTGSITATGAGRLLGVGTDANANGAPDGQPNQTESTFHNATQISGESVYRDVDHSSGSVGIIFDAEALLTPAGSWAVLEILAMVAGPPPPTPLFEAVYPQIKRTRHVRMV